MKTVPLGGSKAAGRVALVDDADYDLVIPHRWTVREIIQPGKPAIGPYALGAIKRDGRWRTVLMHSLITGWPRVDHEDHNGLNNQRYNLRDVTHGQNMMNRKPNAGNSSRYKGVGWAAYAGKWRAGIRADGRRISLGLYTSEEDAALAYDAAARIYHGEFAYLNFPDKPESQAS